MTTRAKLAAFTAAPVTIELGSDQDGKTALPTFHAAPAYSGGLVSGGTLEPPSKLPYVIDLAGMGSAKSPKANLGHKRDQRVGHVTNQGNDGQQLVLDGVLSAETPYRDEVAGSARNGYGWAVSIEASLEKPQAIASGKSVTVNGQTFSGPLLVFRKSSLTGVAFVDRGADEGNSVIVAAAAAGANDMSDFEKFAASLGVDLDHATDEIKARLTGLFDAETGRAAGTKATDRVDFGKAVEAERRDAARQEQIKTCALEAMRGQPPIIMDQIQALAQLAIEKGHAANDFELELLRNTRSPAGKFRSQMSGTAHDPKVMEAALAAASGLPDWEKVYGANLAQAVEDAGLRNNFSLQGLLLNVAHMNGRTTKMGERISVGNVREVLEYCFPPIHARMSGFSAISLPNVLGNVANKQIHAGYMEDDMTWREIAEVRPVSNFFTQNHYRMLDSLEYEEVGSGGELKHGTLGEETYTSQAKTYGKMLALTRNQIINDDASAFVDLRTRLGRGAAKKFGNVFWAAFMDNSSFFTTGLTNYITGATTNLGTDGVGLGLMLLNFRQMTTPSADGSKHIGAGLNPTKVVVPPELEANARINYANNNLAAVANSSANIYAGMFRPVVQWRLSNSSYTGYGSKIWYLFGDELKPMLVTFLNGNQSPTIESTDADFNTLGIQFRGYHDFSCSKSEYLAGCKSKGEA